MFNGEANAEKLNNWTRDIEVYFSYGKIEEDKEKIQLESIRLGGKTLLWWENKL